MKKTNKYIGSSFDDFLKEEGILEETQAAAAKKVFALKLMKIMKEKKISKTEMTMRMHTKSRAQLDRLLDPANTSVTLLTLEKAANAVGKHLEVQLV
ncbi:MAG: Fis family transcriptional regulator [Candidatus Omnitrophota bacterium]